MGGARTKDTDMAKCNDQHSVGGVVYHCDSDPHEIGDHSNSNAGVTWFRREAGGARWVIRHPGAFLWHRIETTTRTACGDNIAGLTLTTLRGRTLAKPPADGLVCPACLSVAPEPVEIVTPAAA